MSTNPTAAGQATDFTPLAPWLASYSRARGTKVRKAKAPVLGVRPVWLGLLPATRRISEGAAPPEEPRAIEDIEAALAVIPNDPAGGPAMGWDAWKAHGMAVWASAAVPEEAFPAFDRFSQKSKKYDRAQTEQCWREITSSPPSATGWGKLEKAARTAQPGWMPPSEISEADEAPATSQESEPEKDAGNESVNGFHFAGEQTALPKNNNPLIRLNEKYAVIGDMGGKCLVLSWVSSKIDRSLKVPSFQSFKSFSERFGNKYVKVGKGEEAKSQPLGAYWLKWPGREGYEGIDLVPNGPKVLENGALNLWGGFGVQAEAGQWPLMRRHICEVLADGDPAAAGYILKFAAWAVQHPGERAEVALVFRGGKGSGKGTFANALVRIFGAHGLQVFNSKHLVGAFNGHLRNCLLLFADEAFWAGDRHGESTLKGMLTERTIVIEQKGLDAVLWENRLHVIMAANAEWVVPASHDERRFAMFDVNGDRAGDRAYFTALHEELMQTGGLAAMLFDLLRVELGSWHPRHIIRTEALRHQKEMSLNPIAAWWEEFLQRGVMPQSDKRVAAAYLLGTAREHASRPSDINPTSLGRFLRQNGGLRLHTVKGTVWELPELAKCRAVWERRYGGWRWENDVTEWKT